KHFGDNLAQFGSAVTVDEADNVYVALGGPGVVDFGGGPLPSAPAADVYLAKYDKDGRLIFANHYGDTVNTFHIDVIEWLVRDPASDAIVMVGYFADTIDFGTGLLYGRVGGFSAFAAKLGSDGHAIWAKSFGERSDAADGNAFAFGAALLPNHDV